MNPAVPLQDAENRHFAGRFPAPVALATAPQDSPSCRDILWAQTSSSKCVITESHCTQLNRPWLIHRLEKSWKVY
jgi:hypothetical protein